MTVAIMSEFEFDKLTEWCRNKPEEAALMLSYQIETIKRVNAAYDSAKGTNLVIPRYNVPGKGEVAQTARIPTHLLDDLQKAIPK